MTKTASIETLRDKAKKLIKQGRFQWRTCWNCNLAHEHLKKDPQPINCFDCGHWFYKGIDITEPDDKEQGNKNHEESI